MQIEPLWDINFLSDWQKFKFNITPCWQSMGKSLFNRWEYKLIQSLHSDLAITIKITNAHTIWLTISLLGIYPTGIHTPMDEMSSNQNYSLQHHLLLQKTGNNPSVRTA